MKALIREEKGRLALSQDISLPVPADGEVLVRVRAASLNPYDRESADGTYDGYFAEYGVTEPVRTGLEFAGELVRGGTRFQPGDRVYGYVHLITGWKAHAEYIAIPEDYLASIPAGLDFHQAAAMPLGILTALAVFQDLAPAETPGHTLIIGAAGGIGVYAVQIAHQLGWQVTALASDRQSGLLRDLGAQHLHDRDRVGLTDLPGGYDLILDLSTRYGLDDCLPLLSPDGKFVPSLPDEANGGNSGSDRVGYLMVMNGDGRRLEGQRPAIESGRLQPVVNRIFPFTEHEAAFRHLTGAGKTGRIILRWAD